MGRLFFNTQTTEKHAIIAIALKTRNAYSSKLVENKLKLYSISLTSCICKTMERMINKRLVWFRKNRITTDQLLRLETFNLDVFVNKEHAVSIFFDFEKAYDTTWKYGILKDFHNMVASEWRTRGLVITWFFLCVRNFPIEHVGSLTHAPIWPQ